jgi:tRNA threonylcarbamoyladenosine biosynthesis protein TsaB
MTILGIETATETCGAAVVTGGDGGALTVAAEAHLHRPRVHARRLTALVEDVLDHAELEGDPDEETPLAAVDAVAVSMGPGSYTGLRIGVSTAKGWAMAGDLALVGVPTLEAHCARLAALAAPGDVICGLIDARRDEVYAAAYDVPGGESERPASGLLPVRAGTTACTVDELAAWLGEVDGRLWVVGDGGAKSRDALARDLFDDRDMDGRDAPLTVVPPADLPPSAAWVARCARPRLADGRTDDLDAFEPFYLKDFHATPAPDPF